MRETRTIDCFVVVSLVFILLPAHRSATWNSTRHTNRGLVHSSVSSGRGSTSVIPSSFRDDYLSSAGVLNVESFFC